MSIVGDLFDGLTGKGGADAAKEAAKIGSDAAMAGIDAQQQNFDYITGLLSPFVQAGTDQITNVSNASSMGGLDQRLGQIMDGDAFNQLSNKRLETANNGFLQAGLSRSGGAMKELAGIPIETALALEDQLFGRQVGLMNNGQNAASGLGAASNNSTNAITSLLNNNAAMQAQGQIGAAQSFAGGAGNLLTAGALLFSDPKLKKNMEPLGKVGDLTLYEWDWVDEMPIKNGLMGVGYNADEVHEKYPQHVGEIGGFKAINYTALNEELSSKFNLNKVA